jgi:outer membrane protein
MLKKARARRACSGALRLLPTTCCRSIATLASDPVLASAPASWRTQKNVPQARGSCCRTWSRRHATYEDFYEKIHVDPSPTIREGFPQTGYTVSASQPLYRPQNSIALSQARQQVGQSDFVLSSAQQDLIIRVTQAYFDVLLARFNIELTESQKAAVSENLAQAKRNFEVGTATITDTNDAQAKFDQIVAQEIAARTDLDNKLAALRAILGRLPRDLKRFGGRFDPRLPSPNALEPWIDQALSQNLQVRIAQANFDIASLEVDRQRAAHYPTIDLVASFNQGYAGGSASTQLSSSAASSGWRNRCATQRATLPGGAINSACGRRRQQAGLPDLERRDAARSSSRKHLLR